MKITSKTKVLFAVIFILVLGAAFLLPRQKSRESSDSTNNTSSIENKKSEINLPKPVEETCSQAIDNSDATNTPKPASMEVFRGKLNKAIQESDDLYFAKLLEDLPIPGTSPLTGNITDLSLEEEREARDIFLREREKWSRFKGLWGELSFSYFDEKTGVETSLDCLVRIRLHKHNPDRDRKRFFFDMIIADKDKQWIVVMDGRGPIIRCDDKEYVSKIKPCFMGGAIVEILEEPYRILALLDERDDMPGGKYSREDYFKTWQAYKNREEEVKDKDKSYMFHLPYESKNVFGFDKGRFSFSGFGLYGREKSKYYFENYQETDGFEFPMTITAHFGAEKIIFKFSNIKIATSE